MNNHNRVCERPHSCHLAPCRVRQGELVLERQRREEILRESANGNTRRTEARMRTNAEIEHDLNRLARDIDALEQRVLRSLPPANRRAYERRIAERQATQRVRVK